MIRKILAILLIGTLAFALPACKKPVEKKQVNVPKGVTLKGKSVRIFELRDAFADREQAAQYRARAIDLKNKHGIDIQFVGEGTRLDMEQMIASILSDEPDSDILAVDSLYAHRLISAGLLQPLDQYTNDFALKDNTVWNTQAASTLLQYHKNIFGIVPKILGFDRIKNVPLLAYNPTLCGDTPFESQQQKTWDWANFEALANSVSKDTDGDGFEDVWGVAPSGNLLYLGLSASAGKSIVTNNNGSYQFQGSPTAAQLLTRLADHALRTVTEKETLNTTAALFMQDKIGMYPITLSSLDTLQSFKSKMGLVVLPKANGAAIYRCRDAIYPVCAVTTGADLPVSATAMALLYQTTQERNLASLGRLAAKRSGLNIKYADTFQTVYESLFAVPDAPYLPLGISEEELLNGTYTPQTYLDALALYYKDRISGVWQQQNIMD